MASQHIIPTAEPASATMAPRQVIATAEPAKCRLLDLPPELRNYIYKLTLTSDEPIDVTHTIRKTPTVEFNIFLPGPLLTSHQIQAEAQPIYFSVNTFRFRFDRQFSQDRYYPYKLDFRSTTPYLRDLKRLEIGAGGITYTVDITHGPASCVVNYEHTNISCMYCYLGHVEGCIAIHGGRCRAAETVIRDAVATGRSEPYFTANGFEKIFSVLVRGW